MITVGCTSSSLAFHVMHCAYKLNKQGDNICSWHTHFPIWNQSVALCPVLTVASSSFFFFYCCFLTFRQVSQEAGQVVWYSHLLKNFPQFVVIHIVPLHLLKFFSRKFLNLLWNNFRFRGSYKKLKGYFHLFLINFPTENILHNHSTILQL